MSRRRWIVGGSAVAAALVVWNLGNFAFFIVAGRQLGPEEFGLLQALLAATIVIFVPAGAFQLAVARLAPGPGDAPDGVARVYRQAWRRGSALSVVLAFALAIGLLAAQAGGATFPGGEIATSLAVVVPMVPLTLSLGRLQGSERMLGFATSFGTMGAPRPVALLVLAVLIPGVYAGLAASAVSMALAALVAACLTRSDLVGARIRPDRELWRRFTKSLPPLLVGLCGIAALTNADVIAAKLALPSRAAGHFAAVSVLAKAVLILPQSLSLLLLPRVSARHAAGRPTGALLAAGTAVTVAGTLLVALACIPLSHLILRIYGPQYADAAGLLPGFVAATAPLAALTILLNHHVARSADRFVWVVGLVALVHVAALAVLHGSAGAIIGVDAGAGVVGLVAHELVHLRDPDGMIVATRALARDALARPAKRRAGSDRAAAVQRVGEPRRRSREPR